MDSPAAGALPPRIVVPPPGPACRSFLERLGRAECPICFEETASEVQPVSGLVYGSGYGSNVEDLDGNRYVDLAAGFGALLLGHRHPGCADALQAQAGRLWAALGDLYAADIKVKMLERVAALHPTPGARALLCQSGSDAVTAALKTAVLHTGRPGILAFEGAYHGLGHGPLAACGYRPSFRLPFAGQLNPHVAFAPYPSRAQDLDPCLQASRAALASGDIGAVLVEPILGRGGCIKPPDAFLPALHALAREAGALLVADEIWTGLGRCGHLLASTAVGVVPDIVCLGKGLGGGLPISACVAPDDIMQSWKRTRGVVHTSTFQGHALACATCLAVLDAIEDGELARRAGEVGGRFMQALRSVPGVRGVTGAGLMVGAQVDCGPEELLRRGYVVVSGGPGGSVLTLTPALTIAQELLEGFVEELRTAAP